MEDPVNPLLYVLAYGAGFVAQGVPADMEGLAKMIEEAIRYPGLRLREHPVAVHHLWRPRDAVEDPEEPDAQARGRGA